MRSFFRKFTHTTSRAKKGNSKRERRQRLFEHLEARQLLAVDIELNFNGFHDRLDDLTADIGISNFSSVQKTDIEQQIQNQINVAFTGFDFAAHTQAQAPPQTHGEVWFGEDVSPILSSLNASLRDDPDFRNLVNDTQVSIWTENFQDLQYSSAFQSSNQTTTATAPLVAEALANVAVQQLGMSFGLSPFDAFGTPDVAAAVPDSSVDKLAINQLDGESQQHFMQAYFQNNFGRYNFDDILADKSFSPFSQAKLAFAESLAIDPEASQNAVNASNFSQGSATELDFTSLPETGLHAVNIVGKYNGTGMGFTEYYRVDANVGDLITVHIINERLDELNNLTNSVDPELRLIGGNNPFTTTNDDIRWRSQTFDPGEEPILFGTGAFQSSDAMVLNFEIENTAPFYFSTFSNDSGRGDYNAFVTIHRDPNFLFQNPNNRYDVNFSGTVTSLDALNIINAMGQHNGPFAPSIGDYYDVNGDGNVSALDALQIINYLGRGLNGPEGEIPPSSTLGTVDFAALNGEVISGIKYYEFEAAQNGTVTTEAIFTNAAGNIDLRLYQGSGANQVGASESWFNNEERIDVSANAGDTFILEVRGTNSDVDLRINNLVQKSGSTVNISGTAANDIVIVDTSGSNYVLDVNGTDYSYSAASVYTVNFDGGDGSDRVEITNSAASDYAYLYTTSYTVYGSGYLLTGSSVEDKQIFSTGGSDRAYFYDSSGNDRFYAYPTYAHMTGPGFSNRVDGFYRAYAYSNSGGYDYAYLYDSAGNDAFYGRSNYSYMIGSGYLNYASGFNGVYALAYYGGYDQAYFYDTTGNDSFYGANSYGYIIGSGYFNYQNGFESLQIANSTGGTDRLLNQAVDYLLTVGTGWV